MFTGFAQKQNKKKKTVRVTALWMPTNMASVLDNPVNTKHKLLNNWQSVCPSWRIDRSGSHGQI